LPLRWPVARRLQTERLILEPLRVDHAAPMVEVLADEALYRHTGGLPPSLAEVRARYARQATGRSPDGRQGWLNWVLRHRDDARLVGFVQATLSGEEPDRAAELAWLIAPGDQGDGLATEAATAMVEWLGTVGITRLSANIHPDNAASAVVAGRLGLAPTEKSREGETVWLTREVR
jgi:RimJ/RimL family protein N-acetyltransferase